MNTPDTDAAIKRALADPLGDSENGTPNALLIQLMKTEKVLQEPEAASPPPTTSVSPENPFAVKAAQEAVKPKKASPLDSIVRGRKVRPTLTVIYGVPGVGKSTFGQGADNPVFSPAERGADQLDVARFPMPKTYLEFKQQVHSVQSEPHDFKTYVVDTLDGVESLIWAEVCEEKKVKSIEELKWGEGYTAAKGKWRILLNKLVELSEKMNVILLAHAHVKSMNDPSLPDPIDIWRIRLHEKSAEVLRECCDNILFACYDVTFSEGRGLHSGNRILRTSAGTGYEAKNRFSLPDPMPLQWSALEQGIKDF